MNNTKCLIIEKNTSNLEILKRLVNSFDLPAINISEPVMALHYLEEKPTNLIIIDTDNLKDTEPAGLTSKLKTLNPRCVVVWVYTTKPLFYSREEEKPDILLKKPFGIRSFQEALVPYMFRISTGGDKSSLN